MAGEVHVPGRQPQGIGRHRHRLVLEAPVLTADGAGGSQANWVTVASFWASLEWVAGEERDRAGRPEQSATHRITLRWRAGLDAGQRLRLGARIFDIRAAGDPDGDRRRLVCLVQEVKP